jgi:glycosyltransferase involved in cell wall biosynthesis
MKNDYKKVSICIPTFGVPKILKKTLDSIEMQTYKDYEIIVSDDTLDDSVLKEIQSHPLRDKITYSKNKLALGSPANWNKSVELANGKYIKIMHHDDKFMANTSLKSFVDLMEKNKDVDFGFLASQSKNLKNGKVKVNRPGKLTVYKLQCDCFLLYQRNIIGGPSATIFKKKDFIQYDNELKWLVDVDQYIGNLKRKQKIAYADEVAIETTSNADHQISRLYENNLCAEVNEYFSIYKKYAPEISNSKYFKKKWENLIIKYKISNVEKLEFLDVSQIPEMKKLTENLNQSIRLKIKKLITWVTPKTLSVWIISRF